MKQVHQTDRIVITADGARWTPAILDQSGFPINKEAIEHGTIIHVLLYASVRTDPGRLLRSETGKVGRVTGDLPRIERRAETPAPLRKAINKRARREQLFKGAVRTTEAEGAYYRKEGTCP